MQTKSLMTDESQNLTHEDYKKIQQMVGNVINPSSIKEIKHAAMDVKTTDFIKQIIVFYKLRENKYNLTDEKLIKTILYYYGAKGVTLSMVQKITGFSVNKCYYLLNGVAKKQYTPSGIKFY